MILLNLSNKIINFLLFFAVSTHNHSVYSVPGQPKVRLPSPKVCTESFSTEFVRIKGSRVKNFDNQKLKVMTFFVKSVYFQHFIYAFSIQA